MSKAEDKYSKRRLKSSYVTTLVSITLVLFMLGMLGLIILHAKKLSDYVKENIGFSIIMKENVKEAGIIQLQKTLDASDYVKSTEYITK
ncbi:MAG: cell division protein FtsX, partial [Bacteroidales bacterium]|nr:cell division protein FtsX [Bacteroidales bacterium]